MPEARFPVRNRFRDSNPIERVRWHLHEPVTRNHQCRSMELLLDLTIDWLGSRNPFTVEDSVCRSAA